MNILNSIISSIWRYLPAYFANATPVAFGGGPALDGGEKWLDGKPFLGSHKTLRGSIAGIFAGLLIGFLQGSALVGFAQGLGAILGDLISSFLKRRWDVAPGESFPLLDQLDFIIVAVLLSQPLVNSSVQAIIIIIIVTVPIHYLTNYLSWMLKMKDNPW
jgi:CDP-2,3-bis-(O-geranylgeranyl)-sn-glycerol synthase